MRSQEGWGGMGKAWGGAARLPRELNTLHPSLEGAPWIPTAHFYLQGICRDFPQEGLPLLMKP